MLLLIVTATLLPKLLHDANYLVDKNGENSDNINNIVQQALSHGHRDGSYDSIYFVGDVMLARHVERLSLRYGHDYPYRRFIAIGSTSAVIANFEGAVPEVHLPTPDFTFRFSVHPQFLPALRSFGVTHASLANNHAYDFGLTELKNTKTALDQVDIVSFGHPNTISDESYAIIQLKEDDVLVFGLMAIDSFPNYADIKTALEQYTDNIIKVAYIHWGPEYINQPSSLQRQVAHDLVDIGFNLIIGHHPHVVQSIELINGVPVFYSLGNFIFDQYFSDDVQTGLMLELFKSEEQHAIRLIGISSLGGRSQPSIMDDDGATEFLQWLAEISDPAVSNQIFNRVIALEW